jgi:ketosteroid isomerase-like protein
MSLGRMGGRAAQAPERPGRAVSQENVEIVLALQEAIGETDFVELFRDDYVWGRFSETVAALFHPDFESANVLLGVETTYQGVDGLRAIWLDWLRPWASYRSRVEKIIDCGDRVVVVHRASGCLLGSTQKVMLNSAFVFTLREGKIVHCQGYPDHVEALKAVGLEA